ncbi:glycosyltransferase family 4 protein [uncultured Tenacibaculum sp.]|uniref:glycosyltransferase family 4 protein n=1 Tax=uncultured Tenacibaculum sp. TaxID=174713 RepID=UPI0026138E54|nr:glycosyltransferase family 4 protein [uncultured Tenacibaculum sp.]
MKSKVLLIGPFPDPISGVSLANKIVRDLLKETENFDVSFINTSNPNFSEDLGSFSLKKMFFYLKLNFNLYKVLKNNIIYITPGQTFFGIIKYSVFILLSKFLRKELIIHVHGNHLIDCYNSLQGIKKRVFKNLISKFSKGIVLSESLKRNLSPFIEDEKIFILYNFAEDYLKIGETKKEFEKVKLVFLSNLMQEKGILFLLDALKKLEKNKINYEAKIAGNIDENLKNIIVKKLNKLNHTEYIGVVNGNNKKELLLWSNTFILPTFYKMEGQPISILEALASQNYIITTKHAGITDIIDQNIHGKFVEQQSIESIYKAVLDLSLNLNELKEIAQNNSTYFQQKFSLDRFKGNFIKILNA